jgi:hypothetical protein
MTSQTNTSSRQDLPSQLVDAILSSQIEATLKGFGAFPMLQAWCSVP